MSEPRRGALFAVLAYGAWGVIPLYWRAVATVDPLVVLAQRVLWSVVFVTVLLAVRGRLLEALRVLRSPRHLRLLVPSGLLIACNWAIFIWAVLSGELAAASLGYFMNPLVNVVFGVVLLGETLRPLAKLAVGCALAGAAVLVVSGGGLLLPLTLALTFATYGYLRKRAEVDSLVGLFVETLLVLPVALAYLGITGTLGVVGDEPWLLASGVVTAVPLLFFTAAARRLPLTRLGFFQYLAPTLQLALALTLFAESVAPMRLFAFGLVWLGIGVVSWDAVRARV